MNNFVKRKDRVVHGFWHLAFGWAIGCFDLILLVTYVRGNITLGSNGFYGFLGYEPYLVARWGLVLPPLSALFCLAIFFIRPIAPLRERWLKVLILLVIFVSLPPLLTGRMPGSITPPPRGAKTGDRLIER